MTPSSRGQPPRKVLATNVVTQRALRGLSQSALAERAGLTRPTVSRIECVADDVTIGTLEKLAAVLDTTVLALLTPIADVEPDDTELARRAGAGEEEFVSADALVTALDEASSDAARYSRAGRPRVVR